MQAKEVHHVVPRHLLSAYDRACAHPELDGEGIELALEFEWLAMRYGIADAGSLTREGLMARIKASRVELTRDQHRRTHAGDWCAWGSRGGRQTLARYGRRYFGLLSRRRWGQITAAELVDARERLRSAREVTV